MADRRGWFLAADEDDLLFGIGATKNGEQFVAAHFGKTVIEKNEIKTAGAAEFKRFCGGGGSVRIVAVGPQEFEHDSANARFVIDDQDSFWRLLSHPGFLSV